MNRKTTAIALISALSLTGFAPNAQDNARIENVRAAARQLAETEKAKGLGGAFTAMRECYGREMPQSFLMTRPLEQCVAQDMIISRVLAEFSTGLSPEGRKANNAPDPQATMQAMIERTIDVFTRMRVTPEDAKVFTDIVRVHGMDAYGKVRYPDRVK